jgi:hypothetical protein
LGNDVAKNSFGVAINRNDPIGGEEVLLKITLMLL